MEIVFFKKADLHRSPNMYNLNDKKNACKKQSYSHDFHLYLFHYIEFETNHQSLSCIYTPVSSGTCTYEDGTAMHRSFGLFEEFRSIEI